MDWNIKRLTDECGVEPDFSEEEFQVEINGKTYTVKVEYDQDYSILDLMGDSPINISVTDYDFQEAPHDFAELYLEHAGASDMRNFYDLSKQDAYNFFRSNYYLPVFKFSHSGDSINTTGFSCPWDSGLAGMVWVPKNEFRKEFAPIEADGKPLSKYASAKSWEAAAHRVLNEHVKAIDAVMQGDVYCYIIECEDDDSYQEACCGFIGKKGCLQALLEEMNSLESEVKHE